MKSLLRVLALAVGLCLPAAAMAAPATWTIPSGMSMGSTNFSGTFVWDQAASDKVVSANIIGTGGSYAGTYSVVGGQDGEFYFLQTQSSAIAGDKVVGLRLDGATLPATGAYYNAFVIGICTTVVSGKCIAYDQEDYSWGNYQGPAPIPTLTEWAMILFGLALAGAAALTLQRRRTLA